MTRNLLLAAFPPELAGLTESDLPGWRVALTGVGALAAARETARLIAEERPGRILFIGTCGGYPGRLETGECISASEAIATSLDEREGRCYRPGIEETRWPATWPLPLPAHRVAVTPGITRSLEGAARLGELAEAEHLELSGVFAAAKAAGVPVGAALAVANAVGPNAHEEWKANHRRLSEALVQRLRSEGVLP